MTYFKSFLSVAFLTLLSTAVSAQGMIDGYFQPKGAGSLTAGYTRSVFDGFFIGEDKMDGVPAHNEISQQILSLYGNYGITDRLTVVANLPYITAEGDGAPDPVNGETEVSGLQDVSLALKYQLFSAAVGEGGY